MANKLVRSIEKARAVKAMMQAHPGAFFATLGGAFNLRIQFVKRSAARLTWRPTQTAPAEQVYMQMAYCLSTVRTGIDDQPETVGQVFGFGKRCGLLEESAKMFGIVHFSYIGDMIFGQDQYVDGSLRVHITDSDRVFILRDDIGRYLAVYDFAENAVRITTISFRSHFQPPGKYKH